MLWNNSDNNKTMTKSGADFSFILCDEIAMQKRESTAKMEAIEAMKVEIDSIRASTLRTREEMAASQKTLEAKMADLARQESEIENRQKVEKVRSLYIYIYI